MILFLLNRQKVLLTINYKNKFLVNFKPFSFRTPTVRDRACSDWTNHFRSNQFHDESEVGVNVHDADDHVIREAHDNLH